MFSVNAFSKWTNYDIIKRISVFKISPSFVVNRPTAKLLFSSHNPALRCPREELKLPSYQRLYSHGFFSRFGRYFNENFGFLGSDEMNKLPEFLYRQTENINFQEFYTFFDMPDSFMSWFIVSELHLWMLLCHLMDMRGRLYKIRNTMVKYFWVDVEARISNLGPGKTPAIKKQLKELSGRLPISLLVYDEGILGTDVQLAGALWYRFFDKNCTDPRKIEVLVRYIRHQMDHMGALNLKNYESAKKAKVIWLPLSKHIKVVFEET